MIAGQNPFRLQRPCPPSRARCKRAQDPENHLRAERRTDRTSAQRDSAWWDSLAEPEQALVNGALGTYVHNFAGGELGKNTWERELFYVRGSAVAATDCGYAPDRDPEIKALPWPSGQAMTAPCSFGLSIHRQGMGIRPQNGRIHLGQDDQRPHWLSDWMRLLDPRQPGAMPRSHKGHPQRLSRSVRQLIISPRREHSRKPDETYERIEASARSLPRIVCACATPGLG